ncbi:hypothetical protein HK096_002817 [Nowakowskiella sp. JEL0078]|nr:hypothetical protein HK096_002817 [Nowakowskiella sp. JEL0078]
MMRDAVKKVANFMLSWKSLAIDMWVAFFEISPSKSRVEEIMEVEPLAVWNEVETDGLKMAKSSETSPAITRKSIVHSPVLIPNSLFAELEAAKLRDLMLSEHYNNNNVIENESVVSTFSRITMTKQESVLTLSDDKKLRMDEEMKNMSVYEKDEWLKVKMRGIGVPVEVLWLEFWNSGRVRGNETVVDEVLGEELW